MSDTKWCQDCQCRHPSDWVRGCHAPKMSNEAELRRMLAWAYSGHRLYCDDGELQDAREHPFIDFKRDSVAELKDKMEQRGLNRLHREICQNTP